MANNILIIEYGMGNVRSVANAFHALGLTTLISDSPKDADNADVLILPGVGAFGDGMKNLLANGWVDALNNAVQVKQKPFLGLCLGMQFVATSSTEHGFHQGLQWIPGVVERFPESKNPQIRIPHIGWNDITIIKRDGFYKGLEGSPSFYFVHSYVFVPESKNVISAMCNHGMDFVASIESDNIFATQFHPEKSHTMGLALLRNFCTTFGLL